MARERARLVRSFSELRSGLLVRLDRCSFCGRTHRGMLGKYIALDPEGVNSDGSDSNAQGFFLLPNPPGHPPEIREYVITARPIRERRLFVIDTGLEGMDRAAQEKKLSSSISG